MRSLDSLEIFVDTSGLLALFNTDDRFHPEADAAWRRWAAARPEMITSNYVLLESVALLQHRLGLDAVRVFHRDLLPVMKVKWVGADLHQRATTALLAADRRHLRLVDCASLELMRELGIRQVFAFDPHFSQYGFIRVP